MAVSTSAHLVVVFRVERDSLDLLLQEVKLAKYPALVEPVIGNRLAISAIGYNACDVLRVI